MKFDFSSYIVSVIMLLFNTVYSQDSFEEFQNQQQQAQEQFFEDEISGFQNYVASVTAQYAAYEQQQDREFEQFKEAVEEKWQDFKAPSKKEYVEYDDDLDSRATVDFEKGEITVEVIVEEEVTEPSLGPTEKVEQTAPKKKLIQQEIKKKKMDKEPEPIKSIFKKSKKSDPQKTKSQQQSLEVKKKIPDQRLQRKLTDIIKAKGDDGKPMLNKQVADNEGKTVTSTTAKAFASELVANNPVAKKTYKAKDGKKRTVYTVKVPLKSDHVNIRADRYKQEVMKQSKRFNIDPIIAFAVMETESAFNPKAKSHIPAYGLMQLVPKSGARDAYLYVYKEDKFLDGDYLYQPRNNIELGCAYLSKIRHRYFKAIKDDERAYICAVPAYNTGIGNVAKALVNKPKLKPAAQKANSMSPDQLYKKLHKDLKYKEARDYLERVWSRKDKYAKLAGK